ncbi:MAG: hypothetical protein ACLS61_05825 [Ruminococcus sp.]
MDLKELYFVLIGLGSFIEGIAVYFLLFQNQMLGSHISVRGAFPWDFSSSKAVKQNQ